MFFWVIACDYCNDRDSDDDENGAGSDDDDDDDCSSPILIGAR